MAEDAYPSMQDLTAPAVHQGPGGAHPHRHPARQGKRPRHHLRRQELGAVYWSPAIDLTADVIKRYDAAKAHGEVTAGAVLNIEDILRFLPHRYPFLLVDRVLSIEPGKSIVALKNVTYNEQFFQGHFPEIEDHAGGPLVEAIAQAGGILLFNSLPDPRRSSSSSARSRT